MSLTALAGDVIGLYGWTSSCCLLQMAALAWWSRAGAPRSAPAPRPASDATWYVPVYVWGLESHFNAAREAAGDGWPSILAAQQGLMLLVVLGSCLGMEGWAGRRGLAARATLGALPLPVVAAIVGVELPWLIISVPYLYFLSRAG